MGSITIEGGHRLGGDVTVQGAKNSVLPILAATLLGGGECRIRRCPHLSDVDAAADILRYLGCKVDWSDGDLLVDSRVLTRCDIPQTLMRRMRSSVIFLGAILARCGWAELSYPGGCELGPRPIDLHLAALRTLGASIEERGGKLYCQARYLTGGQIVLAIPSVGATENLIMAAVKAKGTTVIDNAAREPEIVDLANMLNEMGAKITGAGTPVVQIEGVEELHPVTHRVVGDRIEAGTFITAAALMADESGVEVTGFNPINLGMVIKKLELMGVRIDRIENGVRAYRADRIEPVDIQTLPFPGFPTDMQAQIMVLSALADGNSIITENIFENRFMFASELVRMGADIRVESHHAMVHGVDGFSGAQVTSPDLRGGAALVVAGLIAEGYTEVSAIHHIDRGYERFVEKLCSLGAHVERLSVPDPIDD